MWTRSKPLVDGLREYLAADVRESLKVIAAGLKIFERQEHKVRGWVVLFVLWLG
jgi:hypothetical protein